MPLKMVLFIGAGCYNLEYWRLPQGFVFDNLSFEKSLVGGVI